MSSKCSYGKHQELIAGFHKLSRNTSWHFWDFFLYFLFLFFCDYTRKKAGMKGVPAPGKESCKGFIQKIGASHIATVSALQKG